MERNSTHGGKLRLFHFKLKHYIRGEGGRGGEGAPEREKVCEVVERTDHDAERERKNGRGWQHDKVEAK